MTAHPRPEILLVSKPVAPPWNDSSKNLVKDLALAGERYRYRVLTPAQATPLGEAATIAHDPIYRDGGRFAPGLSQNLRVLRRLLAPDDAALTHFFFAPNPRAAIAARLASLWRPRRTVQTVCSTPATFERPQRLLFADRVIVLSQHTHQRFLDAGVAPHRLSHIPPGIHLPDLPHPEGRSATRRALAIPRSARVAVFPGDYLFSDAAKTFARALVPFRGQDVFFVFACRVKNRASRAAEATIDSELRAAGVRSQALLLDEVPAILELLHACDACALPAESLYAKMDVPLVLLEALALGLPLVVAAAPPLDELCTAPRGRVRATPPRDGPALAAALEAAFAAGHDAASGRRWVRRHFGIQNVARQVEALYDRLLNEPKQPRKQT